MTWTEVADTIETLRRIQHNGIDLWKNLVSVHHAANVTGVKHDDIWSAVSDLGLKTLNYRLDRKDIRRVLMKLYVRAKDDESKERIRKAIHVFADEPEESKR